MFFLLFKYSLCELCIAKKAKTNHAYLGSNTKMAPCVINKKMLLYIEELILNFYNCVVFKSTSLSSIVASIAGVDVMSSWCCISN